MLRQHSEHVKSVPYLLAHDYGSEAHDKELETEMETEMDTGPEPEFEGAIEREPVVDEGIKFSEQEDKSLSLLDKPQVFFYDVETTGLNPYIDHIIQLAAVTLYEGKMR